MTKLLLKQKWYIAIIVVLVIIEPSINAGLNFLLQEMFHAAKPGEDKIIIIRMLTLCFLLWMIKRVVTFVTEVLTARFLCNAKMEVKRRMFRNLLGTDIADFSKVASSGEYISGFTNDIVILENRFYNQIISLISSVISVVILGGSFMALNKKLACAILMFGIVTMFVPGIFARKLKEKNLEYSNTIARFTQKIKEYVTAYPTIKNYSIENEIVKKFDKWNMDTEDAKFEESYVLSIANSVGILYAWFMQFIAVGIGLMLVVEGEIVLATVISAQAFSSDIAGPFQKIVVNWNSICSVKEIMQKLEKISSNNTDMVDEMNVDNKDNIISDAYEKGCDIIFDDIDLEIGNKKIINHFSFTFEKGKKYLVVGVNGSGKSSLFKALKRWFINCKGSILINNRNVFTMDNKELSRIVSYINENVSIFSDSVKENISLFREYNVEDLEKAVNESRLHLDLERIIEDEGRNISSGERRRIEIARSLLETAKVLILDEVVSTLDIEGAYEIEKLVLGFREKTVIFVSHNFSGKLVREYDEILVIESGTLTAHGKYDELIQTSDYFKKICNIKFGE